MTDQPASTSKVNTSAPKKILIKRPPSSQNHTPVHASKRKGEECSLEPKAKHRNLIPPTSPTSQCSQEGL